MKWTLLVGVLSALIIWIVAMILQDWSVVYQVSGTIGVVFVILSAIVSRVFGYGWQLTNFYHPEHRYRSGQNYEDQKERYSRLNLATKLLLIGLPNIITTILCVMYMHPSLNH